MHAATAGTPADGGCALSAVVAGVAGEVLGEQLRPLPQDSFPGLQRGLQSLVILVGEEGDGQLNQLQFTVVKSALEPVHNLQLLQSKVQDYKGHSGQDF